VPIQSTARSEFSKSRESAMRVRFPRKHSRHLCFPLPNRPICRADEFYKGITEKPALISVLAHVGDRCSQEAAPTWRLQMPSFENKDLPLATKAASTPFPDGACRQHSSESTRCRCLPVSHIRHASNALDGCSIGCRLSACPIQQPLTLWQPCESAARRENLSKSHIKRKRRRLFPGDE
jgi:hypothetical protein